VQPATRRAPSPAFHDYAVAQFSVIMAAIAQGEDDVMIFRGVGRRVFLRIGGKEVAVPR